MKETTALNQINKILDKLDYKTIYIELKTKDNKYIVEKENRNRIGFGSDR